MKLRQYVAIAVSLMVLEALGLYLFRRNMLAGWEVVYFFYFLLYGVFPISMFIWRIRTAVSLKRPWTLMFLGVLMNFAALMWRGMIYYNILTHGSTQTTGTNYTDLLIVLSMAPSLIVFSQPNGQPHSRTFFWIDSIQIVLLTYLVYLRLLGIVPFAPEAADPVSPQTMTVLMAAFNVFMLILTALRFWGALTPDEKRFFGVWSIFSTNSLCLITLYNSLAGTSDSATYYELIAALSSYIGFGLFLSLPLESKEGGIIHRSSSVAEILNIVCPAFFTLALLAMGIDAARHNFVFGMGAIAVAFVLHMARSTILQKIYERSQQALKEARDALETMSLTDALTRIANRRCFDRALDAEWRRAIRTQDPLSLLLMDIDYFKCLNDRYGHQAGDKCLAAVAAALRGCLSRSGDLIARYGGEEFAVILPTTETEGARIVAAKMQEAVRSLVIENESPIGLYVTISVGMATCSFPTDSRLLQLLEEADKALYCAKEKGRDRVEVAMNPALASRGPLAKSQ
jgi:diguanylate cyclase (GGDEF)-like protein